MTRVQRHRAAFVEAQRRRRRGGNRVLEDPSSVTPRTASAPVGRPRTLQAPSVPRGRFYFGATGDLGRYYVDAHSREVAERRREVELRRARNVSQVLERSA